MGSLVLSDIPLTLYSGSLSKFMHVAAVGSVVLSIPPLFHLSYTREV